MAGLEGWLKQLVLVVLATGVAEMLLPGTAYRRYARVALGLLVLLAVLVPFLNLLHQGVNWQGAFAAAPAPVDGARVAAGVARLEAAGKALTAEAYRDRVAQAAARAAEAVEGVASATARADVEMDPESPRFGTVRALEVAVRPGAPRRSVPASAGERPVSPVPPVQPVRPEGQGGSGTAPGEVGSLLGAEEAGRLREAVADALSGQFGLTRRQIVVTMVQGGRGIGGGTLGSRGDTPGDAARH